MCVSETRSCHILLLSMDQPNRWLFCLVMNWSSIIVFIEGFKMRFWRLGNEILISFTTALWKWREICFSQTNSGKAGGRGQEICCEQVHRNPSEPFREPKRVLKDQKQEAFSSRYDIRSSNRLGSSSGLELNYISIFIFSCEGNISVSGGPFLGIYCEKERTSIHTIFPPCLHSGHKRLLK